MSDERGGSRRRRKERHHRPARPDPKGDAHSDSQFRAGYRRALEELIEATRKLKRGNQEAPLKREDDSAAERD